MKKERAKGENHQRTALKENAVTGGGAFRLAVGSQVSRPIMIDRFRGNGEHGRACQSREYGNHEKARALACYAESARTALAQAPAGTLDFGPPASSSEAVGHKK